MSDRDALVRFFEVGLPVESTAVEWADAVLSLLSASPASDPVHALVIHHRLVDTGAHDNPGVVCPRCTYSASETRPACARCGPGYRIGDEGCRHSEPASETPGPGGGDLRGEVERLPHADVPGLTPETCPGRDSHGKPFRYCPVKGCGWHEGMGA